MQITIEHPNGLKRTGRVKQLKLKAETVTEEEYLSCFIVLVYATLEIKMLSPDDLINWFTYHAPTQEQLPKYQAIRDAGLNLARAIVENSPPSADQTAAVRKVREACMTANAAIACGGK